MIQLDLFSDSPTIDLTSDNFDMGIYMVYMGNNATI
jgi:hypothetical protein